MTVDELGERMTSLELSEWVAFLTLEKEPGRGNGRRPGDGNPAAMSEALKAAFGQMPRA